MTMTTAAPTRAWVEQIMGLPISIHLRGNGLHDQATEGAVHRTFRRLRWIDSVFSTYRQDSPLSALRRGEVQIGDVTGTVRQLRDICDEAHAVTGGAFTADLPDVDAVKRFDPSGAVKGWAIAEAVRLLSDVQEHSFCINAGGDIAVGHAADCSRELVQMPWRVGIQHPSDALLIARTVELTRGALATSGQSARGTHLYEPASGTYPKRSGSVTVVGPDPMWTDIWATAIFVGGSITEALLAQWDSRYQVIRLG